MSALDDFIMGTSPQIDPQTCKNARIGYDRVWRTAVELLHVLRPGGQIHMTYSTLAKRVGVHVRTARTAVYVLEESGVLRYLPQEPNPELEYESAIREPSWTPSVGRLLNLDIRTVEVSREACQEARVGVDRAWRLSVLWKALKTRSVSFLSELAGIGSRQVRRALKAVGLETSRTHVHTPKWMLRKKTKGADPRTKKNHSSQRNTTYSSSTHAERGPRTRWIEKVIFGGHLMPYHFFEGATNVVPVDTEMKTKDLKAQEVSTTRENYHLSRQNRPVCDWSALDSAKEFKFRLLSEYPSVPGDTGNTVQLAKILGRLRREYGHDARLEIEVLAEWLKDASDILVRNVHVPLWKKYLKALQKHYRLSESVIMSTEKEEETKPGKTPIDGVERMPYLDSVSRFYKNRPVPSEQSKNDLADAVAQDEELVLAMMERVR